jgi:CHAT domain-containing protein/formylglycine-generating enzyme required for sulfatase activity
MEKLLTYYIRATDPAEIQRLLFNYPILFSGVVEQFLSNLEIRLKESGQISLVTISPNIALLNDCRLRGLEEVFPEEFPELIGLPHAVKKDMIRIPEGRFFAGSELGDPQRNEKPGRWLELPDFYIDKFPVTNAEYLRFVLETGYPITEIKMGFQTSTGTGDPVDDSLLNDLAGWLGDVGSRGFKRSLVQSRSDYPVAEISWHDAVEYARWAGKRLPTADEWEKAARGADQRRWSWGPESDSSKGNTRESGIERTTPVSNYDTWPSPYGCCDMSGNVMEWTSTPASGSEAGANNYVIKGGCWSFPIEEAQVWKRHDDPSDDLWDALGFRCSMSANKPSKEQQWTDYEARDRASAFRRKMGVGINDDPSVLAPLAIARTVMAKEQTLEDAQALLTESLRDPRLPAGSDADLAANINRYVISSTTGEKSNLHQSEELAIVASLGLHLASQSGDLELVAQAHFALGKAQVCRLDFFEAVQNFELCLEHYRQPLRDERQLALTLLALGSAEQHQNLTVGTELISVTQARDHLSEALPKLGRLGMKVEEQQAICALAEVERLCGQPEKAFDLARLALSKTTNLGDVADESRGVLNVGDVYLNVHAYDRALYCFRTAYRLASTIAETELIIEARLRIFLGLVFSDPKSAARYGAETLEAIIFFESENLQQALNLVLNGAPDKIAGWVNASFLGNLVSASMSEDFGLPFLPLAECAIGYAFQVSQLVEERVITLEEGMTDPLTPCEEFFASALLALGYITRNPERAKQLADRSVQAARLSGELPHVLISQQIRIEVWKELGCWNEAIGGIERLRPEFAELGQSELLVAYLEYEANLYFWSGNASAALESCDKATIEAYDNLDPLSASRYAGSLHVLRSRILSAIGSRKAFVESEAANMCFFHSGDRLGSARYMIRQAQVILDPAFEGREMLLPKAAERLQMASDIVAGKTLGLTDERLTCELIYTIGLFYLDRQESERASQQFSEVLARAEAIEDEQLQVMALIKSAETYLLLGELQPAEVSVDRALAMARRLGRPFEMRTAEFLAGCVYSDSSQLSKAHDAFRRALELYKEIRKGITNNPVERKAWLKKNIEIFDRLINDVLLVEGLVEEAFVVVQMSKAASLQDLLWESRLLTSQGLAGETANEAKLLWREIRQREVSLERESAYVGDEAQEYRMRIELMTLRKQWSELWGTQLNERAYPEFSESDLKQIWELIPSDPGTTLVEFFLTPKHVLAFVLAPRVDSHRVVQLDHIAGIQLEQIITESLIEPYSTLHESSDEQQIGVEGRELLLFPRLESLLSNLHTLLLSTPGRNGESVLDILKELNTKRLVFIPSGILSLVPLHALCAVVDGAQRYLLDEFDAVSFAPSISILRMGLSKPARTFSKLMAVQDPDGTLPNGTSEVQLLRRLFSDSVVLANKQATKDRVIEALTTADIVHFACHGTFDAVSPLDSGLVLSDEVFSLAQIYLAAKLKPGCLVTLASCESGLVDLSFADEFLGLPSGFMYAGAAGVVSTLWVVSDLSTMLLMERFYRNQRDGMSLASALKESQGWLRSVTAAELEALFNDERRRSGEERTLSPEQVSRAWRHFAAIESSSSRPFEHPFFWAAFTVNGC